MHIGPTFDPAKDAENRRKHGVSLADGDGVLNDPLALTIEDDSAEGEQRFVTVGVNSLGALMVVVFTDRDDAVLREEVNFVLRHPTVSPYRAREGERCDGGE